MAYTINQQRVTIGGGLGLGSRNAAGAIEKNGAVSFLEVDVTSYTTGGESITAGELGFSVLYNVLAVTNELDNDVTIHPVPAADGKTVVINAFEATVEFGNGSDLGDLALTVTGELMGQE